MFMSKDRYLWIHFKSDENIEYKGFKAVYEFVKRPENSLPEVIPCTMDITDVEEGKFGLVNVSTETRDFNKEFGAPIDCLWKITVRPGWRVYLQFAEFNLEKPNDCATNFVQVFPNRTDLYLHEHKEFCGSIAEAQLSKGEKMYVRFFTENIGKKLTFTANFTAFRDASAGLGACSAKADEFSCEDDTCIHKDLKCNEKYNCRTRFDEEDDDCQTSPTMSWSGEHIIIIMVIFSLILAGMCITFLYNCITKLMRDHQTIQEYIRQSREQQLNELEKSDHLEKKQSKNGGNYRSRSRSSPSIDSHRFDAVNAINATTPCYVPGGDVLPILIRNEREHSISPSNGDAYTTNIYTVDHESPPQMCDSACQTRESLFTTQEYSSGNSSPQHSVHTDSPPAPFSTFGYKKETKFKAEAKIEVVPNKYQEAAKRRPYSVQTTKSAPDVIVTH